MNFREYITESTKGRLVAPKDFSAKQKAAIASIKPSIADAIKKYPINSDSVSAINYLLDEIDKKIRKTLSEEEFEEIYDFVTIAVET